MLADQRLKIIVFLSIFLFALFPKTYAKCVHTNDEITNIIFVRHAEKADDSADTSLSEKGMKRAQDLGRFLSMTKINAIYTTPFKRTRETAKIVASNYQIEIQDSPIDREFADFPFKVLNLNRGKTIMIVGHSNTIPYHIAKLTNNQHQVVIEESAFDNIFIIQVKKDNSIASFMHLKYGDE